MKHFFIIMLLVIFCSPMTTMAKKQKDKVSSTTNVEKEKKQKVKKEETIKTITKTVYLYGVAYSPLDSVVYFTDELKLDDMVIEKKTRFLQKRDVLSQQLKNYLTSIGEDKYVCAVFYNTSLQKLDKSFLKQAKNYKDNGFFIKAADQTQFRFTK